MANPVGQAVSTTKITIALAGTAQRLVTDPNSTQRFVLSVYLRPTATNVGKIYVGPPNVSTSLYTELLNGSTNDAMWITGDWIQDARGSHFNYVDLYNTWVNGDNTGDSVMVSTLPLSS